MMILLFDKRIQNNFVLLWKKSLFSMYETKKIQNSE